MGIFSDISEALNSVADAIENAYDTFSEKIHDVFYTPSDYISEDVIVKSTKDKEYETWLITQESVDMQSWTFFKDIFNDKTSTP